MQQKKKSKKKKPPGSSLTPSEQQLVTTLIENRSAEPPEDIAARIPDENLARVFVDRLPVDSDSVDLLGALGDRFSAKPVHKAIRRALFKMKQKGIAVPEDLGDRSGSGPAVRPPSQDPPVAMVGAIGDMAGSRPVVIIIDRGSRGQDLGIGIASDEHGLSQFLFGTFSRKKVRELIDTIMDGAGALIHTSLSHGATILENSYQRHLEAHPDVATDYLELRPWLLEHVTLRDQPPVFEHISRAEVSDPILTDSRLRELFEHDFLKPWVIEFEQLRPFMEDMMRTDGSPIVLTETQKADRIQQIKEKSMDQLFPPWKRSLMKHRLEETAYLFVMRDEDERARLCLAAAETFSEGESALRKNPVIAHILERSLSLYMKTEDGEPSDRLDSQEETSPIITP